MIRARSAGAAAGQPAQLAVRSQARSVPRAGRRLWVSWTRRAHGGGGALLPALVLRGSVARPARFDDLHHLRAGIALFGLGRRGRVGGLLGLRGRALRLRRGGSPSPLRTVLIGDRVRGGSLEVLHVPRERVVERGNILRLLHLQLLRVLRDLVVHLLDLLLLLLLESRNPRLRWFLLRYNPLVQRVRGVVEHVRGLLEALQALLAQDRRRRHRWRGLG